MADSYSSVEWEPDALALFCRVNEEAASLGNDYIGAEHLLLAAVGSLPIELKPHTVLNRDSVRAAIFAAPEQQENHTITLTPWSQTPRFKLAITRAMQRAFEEGRRVSCRDVWHGLLADPESASSLVLRHLGLNIDDLKSSLIESTDSQTIGSDRSGDEAIRPQCV